MEYIETTLALIHPSPTNPRKTFPAEEMAEMTDSVKRHGILQPILVRPWPACYSAGEGQSPAYELVAGERRYRAAKAAELESIPVMVRNLTDHEVLEIQIIENLQRKGLHPIEEAESYALMINDHGYTADQLAEKIGKSRAYIYGRMKLTALSTPARLAFRDGNLTASTALLIARIPGEALQARALDAITKGYHGVLSYRDAAEVIQDEFCMYLDEAKFPQENLMLAPAAGTCSSCPKRSGNAPELFPDIERADVCTDPDCHQTKTKAWLAYQKAQAVEAGKTVISGEEAIKIDIAYSHNKYKYVPLERKNYELEGAPTYRETVAKTDIETVLIEDPRNGTLVEAVDRKALASALVAAGIKPSGHDYREEERELERKTREENKYRQRLFAAWHNELRSQLADDKQPDLETEEMAEVASLLWSNLYSDSADTVMGFWAKPSEKKEHWDRRHEMIREVANKIASMTRRDLVLFLMDCALASGAKAMMGNVDTPPEKLIIHARACGIDPDEIKREVEAEKAAKSTKSKTAKTTSTPKKAPPAEVADCDKKSIDHSGAFKAGDRVQISPESNLGAAGKLGTFRGYNEAPGAQVWLDGEPASYLCHPDFIIAAPTDEAASEPPAKPTTQAARAVVMYIHPDNADLGWSGRGRKPKWVESWLATDGNTLEMLRAHANKDLSSAPAGANEKTCAADAHVRCTKTLELPLA